MCVCVLWQEVGSLERLLSLAPVCLCACSHTHTNKQAQLDFGRDTICPVLPNPVRGKWTKPLSPSTRLSCSALLKVILLHVCVCVEQTSKACVCAEVWSLCWSRPWASTLSTRPLPNVHHAEGQLTVSTASDSDPLTHRPAVAQCGPLSNDFNICSHTQPLARPPTRTLLHWNFESFGDHRYLYSHQRMMMRPKQSTKMVS